jgi:hypothetical protein
MYMTQSRHYHAIVNFIILITNLECLRGISDKKRQQRSLGLLQIQQPQRLCAQNRLQSAADT